MSVRGVVAIVTVVGMMTVASFAVFSGQTKSEKPSEKVVDAASDSTTSAKRPTSTNPLHGKVFGSWEIECAMPPEGKDEKCYVTQNQVSVENKARVLKFSVGRLGAKGEWVAVAILPLGISIPGGVAFKVDEDAQVPMQLQQCAGEGCVASAILDKKILASIKGGQKLNIGMMPSGSPKTLAIQASLDGISAALSALSK